MRPADHDPARPMEGARVRLRRMRPADAAAFARTRADAELGRYQGWSVMTPAEAAAFVTEVATAPAFVAGQWIQLTIAQTAGDTLIGDVGLRCDADGSAEVGFTLAREHHGRGLAHEALVLAVRLLFERTDTAVVRGITDARNAASARLLAAAGLRHVKTEDTVFRGEPCTEWTFERRRDELAVRRACGADAAALAAFAARTFDDTYREGNRPEDHAAYIAKAFGAAQQGAEIADGQALTLLAEDGLVLAGYLQLDRAPAPPGTAVARALHLSRLYVDRPWHGRGLAPRLLDEAARRAAAWGAPALWLSVWECNPRAIAYYRKAGFQIVGTTHFDVGADRQTDHVMQLRIDP
jgi:diamine N-acetyltransferase